MNERIEELADKAEQIAAWITPQGLDCFDNFKEQFALLIVKECAQWVDDNLGLVDEEARADLLKHFGVETDERTN